MSIFNLVRTKSWLQPKLALVSCVFRGQTQLGLVHLANVGLDLSAAQWAQRAACALHDALSAIQAERPAAGQGASARSTVTVEKGCRGQAEQFRGLDCGRLIGCHRAQLGCAGIQRASLAVYPL